MISSPISPDRPALFGTEECAVDHQPIVASQLSQRDQRALVFHLLYAMDAFAYESSLEAVVDGYSKGYQCVITHHDRVFLDAQAVIARRDELDTQLTPLLSKWRIDRLGVATRLILRYALWELSSTNTDPVVIINEALELAKGFAEHDAHRFVNGVLDQWLKQRTGAAVRPEHQS